MQFLSHEKLSLAARKHSRITCQSGGSSSTMGDWQCSSCACSFAKNHLAPLTQNHAALWSPLSWLCDASQLRHSVTDDREHSFKNHLSCCWFLKKVEVKCCSRQAPSFATTIFTHSRKTTQLWSPHDTYLAHAACS